MLLSWNLYQSTSLAELPKVVEAQGCKPCVTNLSIIPHTLVILTENVTYCIVFLEYVNEPQVNVRAV